MGATEKLFNASTHPVFAEPLLRMIHDLSDDIVSWSVEGDSFIIKQASEERQRRRQALPQTWAWWRLVAPSLPYVHL